MVCGALPEGGSAQAGFFRAYGGNRRRTELAWTNRELTMTGSGRGTRIGSDRATLAIVGLVCAIAGFFLAGNLGIVLGPIAVICGWLAMGRRWAGSRRVMALVALVLGAIDTVAAILWTFF